MYTQKIMHNSVLYYYIYRVLKNRIYQWFYQMLSEYTDVQKLIWLDYYYNCIFLKMYILFCINCLKVY